ncbi:hypothetical protein BRADI_2g51637v3 [Brachypodium distachyon]|uniref:XPG N-terminal domain-containing protein n=1 Tax=Brachypodium distachyon TaxID=15368 RepID=A0A2K2DFA8_BRADI|nr:hypothetical protein BRADI_2g51637v3 [Brachypodium distachyon]
MGIQGLLPQLKSIMAPIGVEDLRGQTVAVDTYSWLHKGALSCSDRLCKGIPTTRHIEYCMHRVNLLRHHGVKPILVFDGGFLPMKSEQEIKRARSRKENLERAREHEAAGNSRGAFESYQKAVDITPRIASELIQIIFKMDKFGQGVEFQIMRLEQNRELDFNGFTKQMLLEMCILSGCDYLPSLPGMGVKRAHALIQKLKSHEKVIKHLRYSSVSVPPQYEENFKKAIRAFQFQRVYDPATEDIVHLSGIPHDFSEDDFLGPWLPQAVVKGIALGDIDPLSKEPFEAKIQCSASAVDKVYPIRESIIPSNGKKRLDLPVQKNILTNYFCLASLEAKRKFRAPKVTPKQQLLNGSSLPSPLAEDSATSDSIEDTSLPTNNIQASQSSSEHFSSEPPKDDSINASQHSTEPFSCDFPRNDSASASPHCSSYDVGSDPPFEDPYIEDREVEINYCNVAIPGSPLLERTLPGIADPLLLSHDMEPSRPVPHYAESNVVPTNRTITVRSSYFRKDKRVYTNQGEDQLDDEDNRETGTCTLSGDQLRNPGGIVKRRKHWDPQNFEDEALQPTSTHESAPVDEDCDADSPGGISTNSEGRFGCNVAHVNTYSGIAEKSMDKFAALISSFKNAGSRASGLRAPLKDVKNTLSVRSILRPPEKNLKCMAKKTARAHGAQSRFTRDAPNIADGPPDLSTFAYRPIKTAAVCPDQGKITNNAADPAASPPGLRAFEFAPARPTVSYPDKRKNAREAVGTAPCPPDVSTFAYTSATTDNLSDHSKFSNTAIRTADSPPDLSTFEYTPLHRSKFSITAARTADSPDLSKFAYKPMKRVARYSGGSRLAASARTSRGRFT